LIDEHAEGAQGTCLVGNSLGDGEGFGLVPLLGVPFRVILEVDPVDLTIIHSLGAVEAGRANAVGGGDGAVVTVVAILGRGPVHGDAVGLFHGDIFDDLFDEGGGSHDDHLLF